MTLTTPGRNAVSAQPGLPADQMQTRADQLQTLCALLAFVGLGYALMHTGGRDRGTTEIAMAMAAPSLIAGRSWRRIPLVELTVITAIALTTVIVPLVTPLGISAAADTNAYTYAVVLYLAIRGYAVNRDRRSLVLFGVLCLGIVEFLDLYRVWLGEHDPTFQIVGTFYWHNQFGAFAAAVALIGCAMVMRSGRVEDAAAWLVAPLFLALGWLSHSRAAALAFIVAGIALPVTALLRRHWWALARLACAAALAFVVHGLLIGAVSSGGSAGQGFSPARESVAASREFRLTAGKEAWRVFERAPLLSHGYGSLGVTGWQHAPAGTTTSPYGHSLELQALSDGGLVLGAPVIVAAALLAWSLLRRALRSARQPDAPDWLTLGAGLAALALLLHTSVDFDGQYPVLSALLAAVAATALPAPVAGMRDRLAFRRIAIGVTVLAAVLCGAIVASYWQTAHRLDAAAASLSSDSARSVATAKTALDGHHFTDPRPAAFIVEATDLGYVFDESTLERALRESRTYARLDWRFRPTWQRVNATVRAASLQTGPTTTHG